MTPISQEMQSLILASDRAAAVLVNPATGDHLLIDLAGSTQAEEAEARDRHMEYGGVALLMKGRVIFLPQSIETTPEFRAEIGEAFIKHFRLGAGDGVEWLERLYALEDTRDRLRL